MKRYLAVIFLFTMCALLCACEGACDHEFTSAVTAEPSCSAEGVRTSTCGLCGFTKTETIPVTDHQYGGGIVSSAPGCVQEGVLTYTCTVCGAEATEPIPASGHHFGESYVARPATCAQEGESVVECSVCGLIRETAAIPKTDDHTMVNTVLREPTCTDAGAGVNVCTVCGFSEDCVYSVLEHEYGKGTVTQQPGCDAAGVKEFVCKHCGHTKKETVAAAGHSWSKTDCTANALCTVCGAEKPDSAGHEYVLTIDQAPSQFYAGRRIYRCSLCGETAAEYYGKSGEYDLQAVEDAANAYAQELGFRVIISDEHKSSNNSGGSVAYSVAECGGGQEYLLKLALNYVDQQYKRACDSPAGPEGYDFWIIVGYSASGALGGGFFGISTYIG